MSIHHKIAVLVASIGLVMASVSYATHQVASAQSIAPAVVEAPKDAVVSDKTFTMYHSVTCPHCKEQMKIMPALQEMYPDVQFELLEVSTSKENQDKFKAAMSKHNKVASGVPTNIINDSIILEGYDKNKILATMIDTFGRPMKAVEGIVLPTDEEVKSIMSGVDIAEKSTSSTSTTSSDAKKYIAIAGLLIAFGIGIISLFK